MGLTLNGYVEKWVLHHMGIIIKNGYLQLKSGFLHANKVSEAVQIADNTGSFLRVLL